MTAAAVPATNMGLKRVTLDELMKLLGVPADGPYFAVGARVAKAWSEDGDLHADGARATVIERVSRMGRVIGYMVTWDGDGHLCFVAATKLRGVDSGS